MKLRSSAVGCQDQGIALWRLLQRFRLLKSAVSTKHKLLSNPLTDFPAAFESAA